jgi:hypothetical protein
MIMRETVEDGETNKLQSEQESELKREMGEQSGYLQRYEE